MLKEQPDIVHFSGHGAGEAGLVLVGQDGTPKPATADALSGLFEIFHNVKCVLLNACFAEVQAKAIVNHIDYVVGMKRAVRDDAAIAFATGFYDGLGYGLDIEDAFKLGCNAIQFEVANFSPSNRTGRDIGSIHSTAGLISEDLNPTLLKKEKLIKTALDASSHSDSLAEKLRSTDSLNTPEAIQQYRDRVQDFLSDRQLNPIEEFQLTTLAKVLGISDLRASQILKQEQQKIEDAKDNYRQVFIRMMQKGYYPFDEKITRELQQLQQELGLNDADVKQITLPIILKYEHTSKAQSPYDKPVLTTYKNKKHRSSKILLGVMVSIIGILSTGHLEK